MIERYRQLAERGEPLVADPYDSIPMLPGEANALPKIKMMEQENLNRAIDCILSDEGADYIEARIESLEAELGKLRKIQKAIHGKQKGKASPKSVKAETEKRLVEFIEKHGPATCAEIGGHLGMRPNVVGVAVAGSVTLRKSDSGKVLLAK